MACECVQGVCGCVDMGVHLLAMSGGRPWICMYSWGYVLSAVHGRGQCVSLGSKYTCPHFTDGS